MPRNYGKGGKNRRKGKKIRYESSKKVERADESQCYAKVYKMSGACRLIAHKFPSNERITCNIRGNMRKRIWIATDDIILLSLREFQSDKAEVIGRYNSSEVSKLIKLGDITEAFVSGIAGRGVEVIHGFDFSDDFNALKDGSKDVVDDSGDEDEVGFIDLDEI